MNTKGIRLPKLSKLSTLVGREVYWNISKKVAAPYLNRSIDWPILDITPKKRYAIVEVLISFDYLGDGTVVVKILDDTGFECGILLGASTCAFLANEFYWSLANV
tara:strand:- start:699 stop:1013 length:315 start_codon:yes stop_codon:yes gene_type:complete